MVKIATQPFNIIRKIKNLKTEAGRVANDVGKNLKQEGYTEIYQRPWKDSIVLSAKNSKGDTKTHILKEYAIDTKTNIYQQLSLKAKKQEIDKSFCNEFGREINGSKKTLTYVDNELVKQEQEKRGWWSFHS